MNTFLNYIPVIAQVIVGFFAIDLYIKTSRHNFAFENKKLGTHNDSKWSMQWFDFVNIGLHLAFIAFMNLYFLAGHHDDIITSVIINSFAFFIIYFHDMAFEIDMNSDTIARMKSIKV